MSDFRLWHEKKNSGQQQFNPPNGDDDNTVQPDNEGRVRSTRYRVIGAVGLHGSGVSEAVSGVIDWLVFVPRP
jgi:hypothetical protein